LQAGYQLGSTPRWSIEKGEKMDVFWIFVIVIAIVLFFVVLQIDSSGEVKELKAENQRLKKVVDLCGAWNLYEREKLKELVEKQG